MQKDLERFLDSISFGSNREDLLYTEIEKVFYHKKDKVYEVILKNKNVLPFSIVEELTTAARNGIHGESLCKITFHYDVITPDDISNYVMNCLKVITESKPSLKGILDTTPEVVDDVISILVANKIEEQELKKEYRTIQKKLYQYG